MTAAPIVIIPDSRLSHDVLPVAPLQVDDEAVAGTAVDLDTDGNLVMLAILAEHGEGETAVEHAAVELRSSPSSAGAYEAVLLPEGANASEVVVAVDAGGTYHAFYAAQRESPNDSALLHCRREPDGEWRTADSLPHATGLAATTVPLSRDLVVSGVDAAGQLLLYSADGDGNWSAAQVNVGGALTPLGEGGEGGARVQYLDPDSWVLFGVGPDESGKSVLKIWQGGAAGDDGKPTIKSGPEVVSVENPVRGVLSTYYHGNSAMAMFTDSERGLYSSVHTSDTVSQVPLSNVEKGAAAIGDDHLVRFYGADLDGNLWVLRQTGWAADDSPEWAPIFPFDRDVKFVATPVAEAARGALAAVRLGGKLDLIRQSESTRLWRRRGIHQRGKTTTMETTRYRTLLSVTDASGVPSPVTEVTITPSELVALELGGKTVIASPHSPATVKSDMTGAIEFTQPATGLDSVTFDVTADAADPVSVTPHAYLHALLAGQQSIFTGGPASSMTIPPLTADSLRAATVDGKPLAEGLTPDMALAAAAGINQAASLVAPGANQAPSLVAPGAKTTGAGFALDLDPSAPKFTPLRDEAAVSDAQEQLHEHLIARQAALADDLRPAALAGGEIGEFFGDIWNAIKTGVITVVHWVVDTAKGVISAVVQFAEDIAKGVTRLVQLAWEGVGAVASFIHGVFAAIGAAVEKVVKWLRDFFDWSSIWKTMEEFNRYVIGSLEALETWIESTVVNDVQSYFKYLRSIVDSQFDNALASLEDRTLNPSGSAGSGPLVTLPGSEAQHRWLIGKVTSYPPSSDQPHALDSNPLDKVIDQVVKAIEDSGIVGDGEREVRALNQFFSDLFSAPRDLERVLVADLLKVLKGLMDVVIDAVDVIVTILLDLCADALEVFRAALDAPLDDSPVLTWIWNNVLRPAGSSEPITLGKLACLAFALPVTLASKFETGHGPFEQPRGLEAVARTRPAAAAERGPLENVRHYGSAVLIGIDMANDLANAAMETAEFVEGGEDALVLKRAGLILNWIDVVSNLVIQVLWWPVGSPLNMTWDWSKMSEGEEITNVTWIGCFLPIMWDGAIASLQSWGSEVRTTVSLAGDTALGVVLVGAGVVGAVYQLHDDPPTAKGSDVAEAVVGPLAWATQFPLLYPQWVEESYGATVAVQCVVDAVSDWDWED